MEKTGAVSAKEKDLVYIQYAGSLLIGAKCPICNHLINRVGCHIAHIIPQSNGGNSTAKNLIPICSKCNSKCQNKNLNNYRCEYFQKKGEFSKKTIYDIKREKMAQNGFEPYDYSQLVITPGKDSYASRLDIAHTESPSNIAPMECDPEIDFFIMRQFDYRESVDFIRRNTRYQGNNLTLEQAESIYNGPLLQKWADLYMKQSGYSRMMVDLKTPIVCE